MGCGALNHVPERSRPDESEVPGSVGGEREPALSGVEGDLVMRGKPFEITDAGIPVLHEGSFFVDNEV